MKIINLILLFMDRNFILTITLPSQMAKGMKNKTLNYT